MSVTNFNLLQTMSLTTFNLLQTVSVENALREWVREFRRVWTIGTGRHRWCKPRHIVRQAVAVDSGSQEAERSIACSVAICKTVLQQRVVCSAAGHGVRERMCTQGSYARGYILHWSVSAVDGDQSMVVLVEVCKSFH